MEASIDRQEVVNKIDEYAKSICMLLLEYMAKHNVICGISDDGSSEFYYKGQIISRNELFENFL